MPNNQPTLGTPEVSDDDFAVFEAARRAELSGEPVTPVQDEEASEDAAAEEQPTPETNASESETDDEQEQAQQKGRGVQRRIDKLTAKIRELEARLQPAAAETNTGAASPQQSAPRDVAGKPQQTDFESYDEYIEALTDWKLAEREAAKAAREREQSITSSWREKVAAVTAKHPDFAEVLGEAAVPLTPAMRECILTADAGAELAYHLAKNPEEATRIANLPPVAAARELGRLEAKLAAPITPEPRKPSISKAPPPPTPVRGAGGRFIADVTDPDMPYDQFEKARNAQARRR